MKEKYNAVNPMLNMRHGLEVERFGLVILSQNLEHGPQKISLKNDLDDLTDKIKTITRMIDYVTYIIFSENGFDTKKMTEDVHSFLEYEIIELKEAIRNDAYNKKDKYELELNIMNALLVEYEKLLEIKGSDVQ